MLLNLFQFITLLELAAPASPEVALFHIVRRNSTIHKILERSGEIDSLRPSASWNWERLVFWLCRETLGKFGTVIDQIE
jgi:hypothetical protein